MDENKLKRYIFIRDDDVFALDTRFKRTFDFCLNEKIPIIYGVVPAKLTNELINFILSQKKYRFSFNIAQHGWEHLNYNTKTLRYEFGPKRNYTQQKQDILHGYLKMKDRFKELFTPAFIPPFHFYDQTTLKIINELNFAIFSAGTKQNLSGKTNFFSLPAQISVNKYDSTFKTLPLSLSGTIKETMHYINTSRLIGVYFHHSTLNNYNFDIFVKSMLFLKNLTKTKWIKFISFSDILKLLNRRNCPNKLIYAEL